jgi:hypothetical protein
MGDGQAYGSYFWKLLPDIEQDNVWKGGYQAYQKYTNPQTGQQAYVYFPWK